MKPHPGPALRRMYRGGAIRTTVEPLAYALVRSVERMPWYPEAWAERERAYVPAAVLTVHMGI